MTIAFYKAAPKHADELGPCLRGMDLRELRAVSDVEPAEVLRQDITKSDFAKAVVIDGKCHALFGVCPFPGRPQVGVPWFLSTDHVMNFRRAWIQYAPLYLRAMHKLYPTLTNGVHQENSIAIRWLKRMGFTFTSAPLRVGGEPFILFTRTQYV